MRTVRMTSLFSTPPWLNIATGGGKRRKTNRKGGSHCGSRKKSRKKAYRGGKSRKTRRKH